MGQVMGIGGVFLKCADLEATKAWYQRVLGMSLNDFGGFDFLHTGTANAFGEAARTIFAPFGGDTDYFAPSDQPFMLNLMVDDMDSMLARLESEGVVQLQPSETFSYGRFAWVLDPDGRKIELWQPFKPENAD